MLDTSTVTIAGNVVADPRISGQPDNPDRVNFRVVANRRRRDPESGAWVDAGEFGVNVVCWRALARGAGRSLRRGDPVLVIGRIAEREYQGEDGNRRWFTEVTADFIGHDLSKGTAQFYRFSRLDRVAGTDQPSDGAPATDAGADPAEQAGAGDGMPAPDGFDDEPTDSAFSLA
ncbi:MAG TPA: single-stranded DNA-binding protein [Nakamurella sp.]|jgi:single-strand DNA-binding protein|nr:single-stranded DNA-binding protein [Nakamurella sp.]